MDLVPDSDPVETREWRDALGSVLAFEGAGARALPAGRADAARRAARARRCPTRRTRPTSTPSRPTASRRTPATGRSSTRSAATSAGTRWRSSCAPTRRAPSWAATSRASSPRPCSTTPASCISGTRPRTSHGGDLIYVQGHCSPGIYARSFLEGRLTEERLLKFRQEVDGGGLSSYPHPWLMPDFWQFPTVSMGLGPLMAIYQARFLKYLHGRGLAETEQPQGLGVPGRRRVRRAREPGRDLAGRAREARQSGLRHQLQPAAPRRAGARQRQDHPGAGGRSSAAPAGTSSRSSGARAGTSCSPPTPAASCSSGWRRWSTASTRTSSRRTAPTSASTSSASIPSSRPWSPTGPTTRSGRWSAAATTRSRSMRPTTGPEPQGPADRHPGQDGQGLRHGRGRRGPEHHPSAEEDGRDRTCTSSPTASACR